MHRTTKIKITELNPHVICALCGGYYVNATTIIECLHSFCRTCITRYLETSKHCPICDVMVHKTRPLEHIRSDKTLQDLVYKLVPGLYKSEMKRRREYYVHLPGADTAPPSEDLGYEFHDRIIYTEDEKISLSLELCAEGVPFKTPSSIHGHTGPDNIKINDARYLSCPAGFSVGNLKKFIRMKFDLKQKYEIDIFHTAEPLHEYYTLMDIAYIYTWTRRTPLRLYYTVFERKRPPNISIPAPEQMSNIVIHDGHRSLSDKATTDETSDVKGKTETITNRKRKLPIGPDDVSPNLDELKTKSHEHTHKKDGATHKKRVRKTNIDSTVLESMSESEEQLAKLTLDCSSDTRGLTIVDSYQCEGGDIDHSDGHVNHDNEIASPILASDIKKESATDTHDDTKTVNPSISRFEPLITTVTEGTNENDASKIYEFPHNDTETQKPVKQKGTPGRKKKVVSDTEATPSKKRKQTSAHSAPPHLVSETNLVVSDNHPGIPKVKRKYTKKAPSVKKDKSVEKTDIVKVRKKPGPKPKNRDKEGSENVKKSKGKSNKDSVAEAEHITNKDNATPSNILSQPLCEKSSVFDIVQMGPTVDSTTSSVEADTLQSNIVESTVEKININTNSELKEVERVTVTESILPEIVTSSNGFVSPVNVMDALSPVPSFNNQMVSTPLYGNTPKGPDLNHVEPISPKGPEFRNGVCLEPSVNGASVNKDVPVNHVPRPNHFNNINGLHSPEYRVPITGFNHQDNPDQPLDLTNNGNREEYTKGKIFKTKMLRKPYPKPDTYSPQKDRLVQQNGNGYIVSVTAEHRPLM